MQVKNKKNFKIIYKVKRLIYYIVSRLSNTTTPVVNGLANTKHKTKWAIYLTDVTDISGWLATIDRPLQRHSLTRARGEVRQGRKGVKKGGILLEKYFSK